MQCIVFTVTVNFDIFVAVWGFQLGRKISPKSFQSIFMQLAPVATDLPQSQVWKSQIDRFVCRVYDPNVSMPPLTFVIFHFLFGSLSKISAPESHFCQSDA